MHVCISFTPQLWSQHNKPFNHKIWFQEFYHFYCIVGAPLHHSYTVQSSNDMKKTKHIWMRHTKLFFLFLYECTHELCNILFFV